jgi:hypothetical protein
MHDAPIATEGEITEPVNLCDPARPGRLDPHAVGWTRRPLHSCNLRGRFGAKKRWNYWAFTTETHMFSATISSLDYVGLVFVYLADFERGTVEEKTVVTPLGRGCVLPDEVEATLRFADPRLSVDMVQEGPDVRVCVRADDFGGHTLEADLTAHTPPGHESLGVVIPWSERTFQYTAKQNCLPAQGHVRLGGPAGQRIDFAGAQSFACLDYGRGVWPRRCVWNWGAASGRQGERVIGLNLGGQWTDGTGATENALCVDGRLTKVSEPLSWSYSGDDFMQPWQIRAPRSHAVDLRFTPFLDRVAATNAGLVRSQVHQLLGHYDGEIRDDAGARIEVRGLLGWAEEHIARW